MTERKLDAVFTVYKHTCVTTGKGYVGITKNMPQRIRNHRNPTSECVLLRNAIQKYGWSDFTTEILATVPSQEQALLLEEQYIQQHRTLSPNGYNLKTSGEAVQYSDETKQKMSRALKGRQMSPEWRAKISAALTGKKHTAERRSNMSKALRGKKKPPRTQEHIDKLVASLKRANQSGT